jgi:hypothetical protein
MTEQSDLSDFGGGIEVAYRHDAHKMRGRPHGSGADRLAGVDVNQDVPEGADLDASELSRPRGEPEFTVDGHETHYRLSTLTGQSRYDEDEFNLRQYSDKLNALIAVDNSVDMHEAWLRTDLASAFNESVFYPYTSLKYHTLLVAALLDNYRDGVGFGQLNLVVDPAEVVVAHRTVFADERFSLRISSDPGGQPHARIGSRPWMSWSSAWSRLTDHPVDHTEREDMVLDANLRRIQSWSTALQYIEDYRTLVAEYEVGHHSSGGVFCD